MNYPLTTSSPISEPLPSPNLTEPSLSSPKDSANNLASNVVSSAIASAGTASASTSSNTSPTISAILRSINKPKELNITEYSNKELRAMKKRCRTVMTPSQSRVLKKVLEQTSFPSTELRENLATVLGMKPRTVQIWFQNQRQKSRQGRSSSEDLSSVGSPDCENSSDGTDIEDTMTSPIESPVTSDSASPGFTALTAAAFALSNTSISAPLDPPVNSSEHQRYSTFHGAVYKSIPGCMPSSGVYRGNTAAAMHAKRMTSSSVTGSIPISQYTGPANFLPTQPQNIPQYSMAPRNNNEAISLDILASAVSNFRPNGYNYYLTTQAGGMNRPLLVPQPQPRIQSAQAQAIQATAHLQQMNRNRLAPLRTPSPPSSDSPSTKLPSLKALAQVASIGMEMEQQQLQVKRSNSMFESGVKGSAEKYLPEVRRFSATEVGTNNISAPNSAATSIAARRPW